MGYKTAIFLTNIITVGLFPPFFFYGGPCFDPSHSEIKTKVFGWQSLNVPCLFNLKDCDITCESWGGISCHWGSGSTFPCWAPHPHAQHPRTWFQPIFICASHMVKHNILTASSSQVSEREIKVPPCPNFKSMTGLTDGQNVIDRILNLLTSCCSSAFWMFFRLHQV